MEIILTTYFKITSMKTVLLITRSRIKFEGSDSENVEFTTNLIKNLKDGHKIL
jgi:hypothetical protein